MGAFSLACYGLIVNLGIITTWFSKCWWAPRKVIVFKEKGYLHYCQISSILLGDKTAGIPMHQPLLGVSTTNSLGGKSSDFGLLWISHYQKTAVAICCSYPVVNHDKNATLKNHEFRFCQPSREFSESTLMVLILDIVPFSISQAPATIETITKQLQASPYITKHHHASPSRIVQVPIL